MVFKLLSDSTLPWNLLKELIPWAHPPETLDLVIWCESGLLRISIDYCSSLLRLL